MSRIGNKPISIPSGVTVEVNGGKVIVTGPKGVLSFEFAPEIKIEVKNSQAEVVRVKESPKAKSLHGLSRTLLENMILGVTAGWNKGLELVGVGYRASIEGENLVLHIGFSHPVIFPVPAGITFEVKENTKINVSGIDKQLVGETAARIRRIKPPEPYKGKGIRYVGEVVRKKAGKAAKAVGGPGAGVGTPK